MSDKLQLLLQEAMELDSAERREMIARLQESLPHAGFATAEIHQAWIDEIERREDQYARGEMKPMSREEFRERLRMERRS